MSTLDFYLDRKATVLAQRRADFTAFPEKATVRIQAKSWVAGNTGARPVRLGETLWITDSAPALAGNALGPTAPEVLLGALASCLVHTYLIQAVLLDMPIEGVEIEVQGAVPMGGVVGLPYDTLPQLEDITYTATVIASAPAAELERMHQAVEETCPVLNTLRYPTAVTRTSKE
ncbi:MAG: OsmC family protein [Caldilineaceae bacterium]|jgi:uncharacterized OsmC-like protein|nr:OsmC family protein [Caldilineaceae bacterium]